MIKSWLSCNDQFLSSYFLVPKADGSTRFILKLKLQYLQKVKIDSFMSTTHFKLQEIQTTIEIMSKGSYTGIVWKVSGKVSKKYIYFRYCCKTLKFFKVHLLSVDTLLSAAFPWLEGSLVGGFRKVLEGTRASFFDGTLGSNGGVLWGRILLLGIEKSLLGPSRDCKGVGESSPNPVYV